MATAQFGGAVNLTLIKKDAWLPPALEAAMREKKSHLAQAVRDVLRYLPRHVPQARDAAIELIDRLSSCVVSETSLTLVHHHDGRSDDYGEVGHKVVTTAGMAFLVDAWQNSVEL